ncbi:SusC/RagA family TonB-linked outer membrane protein [Bacteroides sp.]|uniref:SusC/RagA family TonB-linked outer membrane protein n=1 Tax=Bacteroides sp. TaxID=29523 RepID=UPI002634D858|nr:SusC/RagA family TonB-linked outer membrane protein [Bacteroides sp.]MDD3039995.1 SusC/RagA family TonB-linked outer membrane protein [Bacteroides sp.]
MREKRSFIVGCCLAASLLVCTSPMSAQTTTVTVKVEHQSNRIIKGTVTDLEGHSLPGVNVVVKGFQGGTVCDIDGNFKISAPREDVVLKFSYIGMLPQEITVKANQKKDLQVRMKEDANEINEVVVTGFANIRKESFTGNAITVKREDILKVNKTNVIAALQTFDPSFRIAENTTWGSDPNALPEAYMRGKSAFGTKELDLDVTNKSSLKNNPNLPTFIMDGFEIDVTKLYDFDPNRIESVTMLRDAAATAMYGSRAANGVIVITTVAPKPGKLNIAYSLTGEVEMPDLSDYNLMNASEKLEAERLAGCYDMKEDMTISKWVTLQNEYTNKLFNIRRGVDSYWMSKPLRTSFNTNHSLYIDGGTEQVRFGVEVNMRQNNGVMKGSYRNVWGAGTYIDYRIGRLQVRNHTTFNISNSAESPYGSFADYTSQSPYDVYEDQNGKPLQTLKEWHQVSFTDRYNPLYEATLKNYDKSSYEELVNNLSVQWNIIDYLLFKSTLGLTRKFESSKRFLDPNSIKNSTPLSQTNLSSGELTTDSGDSFTWDWQASLAYNRFVEEHNINVSLGLNMKEDRYKNTSAFYRGFPSGALSSPNYAQEIVKKPKVSDSHARLIGLTGLVNYSFQDIYLFDASMRLDGSSKFGSNSKFAPFWSFGTGLNLNNYEFMKNLEIVNLLKVRASYGQVGKVNFSSFAARTTYEILSDEWYKTGYGAVLYALGNKDLTWETTNTFDLGAELRMWNGKLYIRGNYYNKRTVDLINDVTIPSHTGFTTYKNNVGEIENKGFELDVRSDIFSNKDWYVAVFANLAHNQNKILKISESMKAYNDRVDAFLNDTKQSQARLGTGSKSYKKYEEGGSESSIWAMRSLGINPANGEELFLTPDGKVTNVWNSAYQVVVGSLEPDAQGSFGVNARWKNFSLYATFMYEWGGQRYNQTLADKVENVNVYEKNADRRVLTERWQKPGDIAMYKKLEAGDNISTTKATSRFVQDYNWLSLNSITLGYDFDNKLITHLHLSMLRFEVGANELFRISSIKQERGLSYPYSRTLNFSLKASF